MLLFMDIPSGSQGLYANNSAKMLDGLYTTDGTPFASLVNDPDPLIGANGKVIQLHSAQAPTLFAQSFRKVLPNSVYTLGFACRIWLNALPTTAASTMMLVDMRNTSNASMCNLRLETDGRISAYRGGSGAGWSGGGTLLGTSAAPAFISNAWQHVEVKMFSDGAAGTIEVRVNGVTVLNLTGQNTLGAAGPCTQFACGPVSSGVIPDYYWYMKDMVVWDTTGSFNNNFMGSVSVKELIPDGDVSANWAVTGSATHFGAVNEAPPDDDTKYIYAVTPAPAADVMSLTNLPVDVTTVRGLMVINRAKNTDGGDGKLQAGLISGASTQLYTDRQITTAYTYWTDISETDPATAAAWLPGAVNAMNLRLNRTL